MALSDNASDKKTKNPIDNNALGVETARELTAADYRRKAKEHMDAVKDPLKIFGKVGIICIAAAIAIVFLGIAWFVINNRVSATGSSISANSLNFELAVPKAVNETTPDVGKWHHLLSGSIPDSTISATIVGSESESVFWSTGDNYSDIAWVLTDDSNMQNQSSNSHGIIPGSSGKLTFYIISKIEGDLEFSLDLVLEGFGDPTEGNNLPALSTEAQDLLEGHVLLFVGSDVSPYSRWISKDADSWSMDLNYGSANHGTLSFQNEDGNMRLIWSASAKKDTAYPVTIYWIWPEVFGQYLFTEKKTLTGSNKLLFPNTENTENVPGNLPSKLFAKMCDAPDAKYSNRYFKWSSTTASQTDLSEFKSVATPDNLTNLRNDNSTGLSYNNQVNYIKLASYYNRGDQFLGENVRYIHLKVNVDESK